MLRTNNLTIFLGCYHLRLHLQNHHVIGILSGVLRGTNVLWKVSQGWRQSHHLIYLFILIIQTALYDSGMPPIYYCETLNSSLFSDAVIILWPKATWGRKDSFGLEVHHWRKPGQKPRFEPEGRNWSRDYRRTLLTGMLLTTCLPCFFT